MRLLIIEFGVGGLPGNSLFDGIWDVSFHLATCVELFETYHIVQRVGGRLYVILRFRYWSADIWVYILYQKHFSYAFESS